MFFVVAMKFSVQLFKMVCRKEFARFKLIFRKRGKQAVVYANMCACACEAYAIETYHC